CPSVSGLSSDRLLEPARGHPACTSNGSAAWAAPPRNSRPHSGQPSPSARWSRNSEQTGHSRLAPRRIAISSWSSVRCRASRVTGPRPSQRAEHSHDLAEHVDVRRVDRLVRAVLGLEADPPLLAEEALDGRLVGRLVVAYERDDDVAVAGVLLPSDDHVV